ncbi:hypothetical protein [Kangiella spongicola]|nr:hypothetical protein [Kangiella spongicola]
MKFFIITIFSIFTVGCSDLFIRGMDEMNASMGGQRACVKESNFNVTSYDGFSYKTGGLCNDWQGQIKNYTTYTIRCANRINGTEANTIFAKPRETTELEHIGPMSGSLNYKCVKWSKSVEVWRDYPEHSYQILVKVDSAKKFISVKNLSSSQRKCFIKDENDRVLTQSVIGQGQILRWVKAPSGDFFTNCLYV